MYYSEAAEFCRKLMVTIPVSQIRHYWKIISFKQINMCSIVYSAVFVYSAVSRVESTVSNVVSAVSQRVRGVSQPVRNVTVTWGTVYRLHHCDA
jgi:hypothetical protein